MSFKPLKIALLWHMHQPVYSGPNSAIAVLPWTRLHALKDYLDMALYCESTGFPATFNLVPSLLDQIEGYASGELSDEHLELSRKPLADLSSDERHRILTGFFSANLENLIARAPRFIELFERYGRLGNDEARGAALLAPDEDILDLVVHFNLAWCGEALRNEPEIKALILKGRSFSEEDKKILLEKSTEWIGRIIPTYKRLFDEGLVDLSVSPYYHPILPLLCDTECGRDARSDCVLPERRMAFPEDAAEQIYRAVKRFERLFGAAPKGMWPSEGGVSEGAVELIANAGIKWIATDEAILRKSQPDKPINPEAAIYTPWRFRGLNILFRDHRLSDKIGFDYSKMPVDIAVGDFLGELGRINQKLPHDSERLVTIALDGENAWEFFPENGREFITKLYNRLLSEQWIEPVKISEYLIGRSDSNPSLRHLAPGSWIDGDFGTWIGNPEKNRAWDELALARAEVELLRDDSRFASAMEHILVAEGSDWFWWFGRDLRGLEEFDILFRKRIEAVYRALDREPPESLKTPILGPSKGNILKRRPNSFISPTIDGKRTNFFEWQGAGILENTAFFGAMHGQSASFDIKKIFFGFDSANFYLRIDTGRSARAMIAEGVVFILEIESKTRLRLQIGETASIYRWDFDLEAWRDSSDHTIISVDEILEIAMPLANFTEPRASFEWSVHTKANALARERYPACGAITTETPSGDFEARNWIA